MGEQDTIKKLHDEIDILNLRVKELEYTSGEKNLIKILASLPLPALLLEADETIQYINTEFEKISGYNLRSIDSLIDLFDLICPGREYRETVMADWKKAMKENENPEPSELNVDITCKNGSLKNILFRPVKILNNKYVIIARDNTEKKQLQEILKQKLISPDHPDVNTENITFHDLFHIDEIQKIQDIFSEATGVASIITEVDGTPITKPSNFCRLCNDIIRKTEKGRKNCYHSDAMLGKYNPSGPVFQPCLSGSLWDGGTSIRVGDRHVANWLIGQILDEDADTDKMMDYAREIGADEKEYYSALKEVKRMPVAQFKKICEALYLIANQLSLLAVQNIQIERDLRESEEKFRIIGNSVRDGIVMLDAEGNISIWNKGAEKIFGYRRQEADEKNFISLVIPERFHSNYFEIFKEFMKKGKEITSEKTFELTAARKNGEEFPVEISLSSVNIKGFWHATGILRDITQRKKIEEAIIDSEKFLRSTIDSLSAHIAIVDENGEIITVNRAWEDFAVENNAEINVCEGANYLQVCDGATGEFAGDAKAFAGGIRRVMNGEKDEFSLEYSCDSPGEQRWFAGKVTKFSQGGPVRIVISHENITDRKKAEEELRKSHRELENTYKELKAAQSAILQREKMASIGQLAAGVAHEINNPIGFVSGNLRALNKYIDKFTEFIDFQSEIIEKFKLKEVLDEMNSKKKKLKIDYIKEDICDLIKESLDGTERVSKIVQNLKTFSRIDEASYKEADINECIESTVNIVWNELKYKAEVKKNYGTIPKIKCYPQELNQVFMNLLVNASHAIEHFGEIIIKTWHDRENIFISVSDTGSGISEEIKNRIFEPFFTTKDVGKGTGLGLSITYDIIKKHNGEITVESETGKGSTFTVKIPVTEM